MPLDFSSYQAILLDLDGTIYHEDHALPGAIELIRRLQEDQRHFACLSNTSASPLRVMARLENMGVDLDPNNIYTAAAAACDYVLEQFPKDEPAGGQPDATSTAAILEAGEGGKRRPPRIFNLATESVDEMLGGMVEWVQTGAELCDSVIVGPPASVFAGEERQRTALELCRRGAALVGICADRVFPSPRGVEFGAGALSWMLAYASGVEPVFCGKPEKIFFYELCRRLGVDPEWCLLIGDNLESDVCGAKSVGMRTILTLSGVTRTRDLVNMPDELQPDLVVEDLTELL
jgi:HAD superfamily hydrolase (TIGR01450 family)